MSPAKPEVSVVVASRGRPYWLARCLTAIAQLDYAPFEVVVVADRDGIGVAAEHDWVRRVPFESANLSAARNLGAAEAGGLFVAFIDDDAVPEPMWLAHHVQALRGFGADASVGYVRGRNGITFQSRAQSVDAEAETHDETSDRREAFIPSLAPGRAVKLVGTNSVYLRDTFAALGGFDEAFEFFLEDSDLSVRLSAAGGRSVVAPAAEVHHGFAPSDRRGASRRPLRLRDIGRSSGIFQRRHEGISREELWARVQRRERSRLIRHMIAGTIEPGDVARLLTDLREGWHEGLGADLPALREIGRSAAMQRVPSRPEGHSVFSARLLRRRRTIAAAKAAATRGDRTSVFSFSLTPVRHRVRYLDGVWVQTGGQFGRAERDAPFFTWCRFAERLKSEIGRVAIQRGIKETAGDRPPAASRLRVLGGAKTFTRGSARFWQG